MKEGASAAAIVEAAAAAESKANGFCYDFQKGKCKRGKTCKYKHEIDRSRTQSPGPNSKGKGKGGKSDGSSATKREPTPPPAGDKSSQVCRFFKRGACTFGDKCNMSHVLIAAASAVVVSEATATNTQAVLNEVKRSTVSWGFKQTWFVKVLCMIHGMTAQYRAPAVHRPHAESCFGVQQAIDSATRLSIDVGTDVPHSALACVKNGSIHR